LIIAGILVCWVLEGIVIAGILILRRMARLPSATSVRERNMITIATEVCWYGMVAFLNVSAVCIMDSYWHEQMVAHLGLIAGITAGVLVLAAIVVAGIWVVCAKGSTPALKSARERNRILKISDVSKRLEVFKHAMNEGILLGVDAGECAALVSDKGSWHEVCDTIIAIIEEWPLTLTRDTVRECILAISASRSNMGNAREANIALLALEAGIFTKDDFVNCVLYLAESGCWASVYEILKADRKKILAGADVAEVVTRAFKAGKVDSVWNISVMSIDAGLFNSADHDLIIGWAAEVFSIESDYDEGVFAAISITAAAIKAGIFTSADHDLILGWIPVRVFENGKKRNDNEIFTIAKTIFTAKDVVSLIQATKGKPCYRVPAVQETAAVFLKAHPQESIHVDEQKDWAHILRTTSKEFMRDDLMQKLYIKVLFAESETARLLGAIQFKHAVYLEQRIADGDEIVSPSYSFLYGLDDQTKTTDEAARQAEIHALSSFYRLPWEIFCDLLTGENYEDFHTDPAGFIKVHFGQTQSPEPEATETPDDDEPFCTLRDALGVRSTSVALFDLSPVLAAGTVALAAGYVLPVLVVVALGILVVRAVIHAKRLQKETPQMKSARIRDRIIRAIRKGKALKARKLLDAAFDGYDFRRSDIVECFIASLDHDWKGMDHNVRFFIPWYAITNHLFIIDEVVRCVDAVVEKKSWALASDIIHTAIKEWILDKRDHDLILGWFQAALRSGYWQLQVLDAAVKAGIFDIKDVCSSIQAVKGQNAYMNYQANDAVHSFIQERRGSSLSLDVPRDWAHIVNTAPKEFMTRKDVEQFFVNAIIAKEGLEQLLAAINFKNLVYYVAQNVGSSVNFLGDFYGKETVTPGTPEYDKLKALSMVYRLPWKEFCDLLAGDNYELFHENPAGFVERWIVENGGQRPAAGSETQPGETPDEDGEPFCTLGDECCP
jgi:hypothetical protein